MMLLFCSTSYNVLAAEINSAPKFNFDDNYQEGEQEAKGAKEDDLKDQKNSSQDVYDPFEKFNRKIFAFNETMDKYVALPVVRGYEKSVPEPIRNSVHNFITNLYSPLTVINSLLQGNATNAMASFSSFLINTTVGIGGIFDVANKKNIHYQKEDLGQTLGSYGSKPGPYLVIPILGPSDLRDFSGFAVEELVNPLSFNVGKVGHTNDLISIDASVALTLADGIDTRESFVDIIDDIRKNSFDVYATMRSAYLQNRNSLILNQ